MLRLLIITLLLVVDGQATPTHATAPQQATTCRTPFALPAVKLKDHSLFFFDGWYYLVAIRIDLPAVDDRGELTFAYARTRDFCTWEELAAPLRHGAPGDADESYIWAPHVVLVGETFYMYYTGVNRNIAQSIMLATSTNPADPQSWTKQGVVFRPQHPDAVYPGPTHWADCRDPMVLAYNGRYYLYYTGVNRHGPIIGVAVADAPAGPWRDLGAVYQSAAGAVPESPYVIEQAGVYYLFYNEGERQAAAHSGAGRSPRSGHGSLPCGSVWAGRTIFISTTVRGW
ncbi:MAG: family 43 glycosylhydrolase [Chloroflexaceae bacterium]|nr:family 43 glycosylhydrolase [Chloroflexaceae bacterium]